MKNRIEFYVLCLLLAIGIIFAGCTAGEVQQQKETSLEKLTKTGALEGENKTLGNGTVYSWVMLDKGGNPSSIGVNFTASALEELPEEAAAGGMAIEYTLALPEEAASIAYDHIGVDWNPQGHDPHGIYDKPHFDFHFYMIDQEARDKITVTEEDMANLSKEPKPDYIPEGYVSTPGGVPRMGAHWIDPTSPEFNGQPFNETLIYGFYNGKMVFVEPMVTIDFLQKKPQLTKELKLPKCYPTNAYYPTNYSINYNETSEEYTIALEGLTLR